MNNIIKSISFNKNLYIFINLALIPAIVYIIGKFLYLNCTYSILKNEKYSNSNFLTENILNNDKKAIVITNSLELIQFTHIYGKYLTPLASHYSLQPNGYIYNLTRFSKNFELMNIDFSNIMMKIGINAPKRTWLVNRVDIVEHDKIYFKYYFDEMLFMSTYSNYNNKMVMDNVITKDKLLTKSFFEININNKDKINHSLNGKELLYLIDPILQKRLTDENNN
jgi:hypothetical protein